MQANKHKWKDIVCRQQLSRHKQDGEEVRGRSTYWDEYCGRHTDRQTWQTAEQDIVGQVQHHINQYRYCKRDMTKPLKLFCNHLNSSSKSLKCYKISQKQNYSIIYIALQWLQHNECTLCIKTTTTTISTLVSFSNGDSKCFELFL